MIINEGFISDFFKHYYLQNINFKAKKSAK